MKNQCSLDFAATLHAVGLTYHDWSLLSHRTTCQHARRTHWVRQFVRKVQRVHTGDGMWYGGRYVTREEGPSA